MNQWVADLRVGLRLLWRDRAFAMTAGLTLAVCIGANVALFSVVRGVLLKPLALPDADRVVIAGNVYPGAGVHDPIGSAVADSIAFGFVALFLSAIGIYGVLAYLVAQRRKEIGIRVALGSTAAGVFQLVLREGLTLVGAGLMVGAAGSFLLRRTLESQLFGVTASNPIVLLAVSSVLAVVALVACAVPARRATRIDPLIALNE